MEFRDSSNAATLSARTQCHQCHLHFLKSQKLSRRLSFRESITGKKTNFAGTHAQKIENIDILDFPHL
jgi:hypothetical protein